MSNNFCLVKTFSFAWTSTYIDKKTICRIDFDELSQTEKVNINKIFTIYIGNSFRSFKNCPTLMSNRGKLYLDRQKLLDFTSKGFTLSLGNNPWRCPWTFSLSSKIVALRDRIVWEENTFLVTYNLYSHHSKPFPLINSSFSIWISTKIASKAVESKSNYEDKIKHPLQSPIAAAHANVVAAFGKIVVSHV